MKRNKSYADKICISAVVIALYVVVMLCTQEFAFGQYQIRIATALYALPYFFPFLVVPMGAANLLSNLLMGGLGPWDAIGGFCVGVLTSFFVVLIRKMRLAPWLVIVPITLIPGLGVPIWLSYYLELPYLTLAPSLLVGQLVAGIAGALLIKALKKPVEHISFGK